MNTQTGYRMKRFVLSILFAAVFLFPLDALPVQKDTKKQSFQGIFNPAQVYKNWNSIHGEKKNALSAQADLLEAQIKSAPHDAASRYELGKIYYELCLLTEAQTQFEKAAELDKNNLECRYLLGCVYYFTRQHDKRLEIMNQIKRKGFRIDDNTASFFRQRTPEDIEHLRKKIHAAQRQKYVKDGLGMTSIHGMLALPNSQIDVATGALLIAQDASQSIYDTTVDINRSLAKIDAMADELHLLIGDQTEPSKIISIINTYIFQQQKFVSVDKAKEYYLDPNNIEASKSMLEEKKYDLLSVALDTKKGTALSLSLLYVSIAQRLGMPIYAVLAPFHTFVRYDDGHIEYNMEMTYQGNHISTTALLSGYPDLMTEGTWYLRPLTPRETLYACITGIAELYIIKQDYSAIEPLLLKVIEADPGYLKPYTTIGNIYFTRRNYADAIEHYKKAVAIYPSFMPTRLNLAVSYLETGDLTAMYDILKQGEKNAFDYEPLLYLMGLYYVRTNNFSKAEEYLLRADKQNPNAVRTSELLITVYCNLKQFDKANKYAKKIIDSGESLKPELFSMIQNALKTQNNAPPDNDDK
ncbi:tetratricopeptide repeat protein [bacterium]|nr:tetratricopeptide repeat protein [bacterium]